MAEYDSNLRKVLEEKHGEVMTTAELQEKYIVEGFGAGLCVVTRKSDGVRGSLWFTHAPRFYYKFEATDE